MNRELDGIFIHVQRDEKWENLCLSDCTESERERWLATLEKEALIRCIHVLADMIRKIGDQLDLYGVWSGKEEAGE